MTNIEKAPRERRDWINTVSLNHVQRGVVGSFTQADHGSSTRLARLQAGDRIVFYSPRTDYPDGEPLQQFTAIGVVTGAEVYQVQLMPDFRPWRREVAFAACLPAPIKPLLSELSFIPDLRNWGFTFRRGLFAIPADDFDRIAGAMGALSLLRVDAVAAASA
ncbi:MAG: EVE domain-containing protein [Actinobacteria bacterium]|nr:EVE domain-containing protein [Actinomycetota bacterium]